LPVAALARGAAALAGLAVLGLAVLDLAASPFFDVDAVEGFRGTVVSYPIVFP
jgi:hypothetical protein